MSNEYHEFVNKLLKNGEDILAETTPEKANMTHLAMGVSGEAGELLDAIKKHTMYNKPIDKENIIEEMGDIEFYLEGLRQALFISREQTIKHNTNKLMKRYHKGNFSNEQAQERADKE